MTKARRTPPTPTDSSPDEPTATSRRHSVQPTDSTPAPPTDASDSTEQPAHAPNHEQPTDALHDDPQAPEKDDIAAIVRSLQDSGESLIASWEQVKEIRESTDALRVKTVAQLYKSHPEERTWFWDGLIPEGKFALLTGYPKFGKSTLAYQLGVVAARGGTFCGRQVKPCRVLIVVGGYEESEDDIKFRLKALGVGEQEPLYFTVGITAGPRTYEYLKRYINARKIGFVLVDSYTKLCKPKQENDTSEMEEKLSHLLAVCRETGATFKTIHHNRKTPSGGSEQSGTGEEIRGGSTMLAGVDVALSMTCPEGRKNPVRLLSVYGRYGAPDPLVRLGESGWYEAAGRDVALGDKIVGICTYTEMTPPLLAMSLNTDEQAIKNAILRDLMPAGRLLEAGGKGVRGDPKWYKAAREEEA